MAEIRTFPDAVLTSGRLTLRPFTESDIDAVLVAATDPVTQAWLPLPQPYLRYVRAGRVDLVIYSLIRADLGLPASR